MTKTKKNSEQHIWKLKMKNSLKCLLIVGILFTSCNSKNIKTENKLLTVSSKNIPMEKTYRAFIRNYPKDRTDGTCDITEYCIISFKLDSVSIYYSTDAACNPRSLEAEYTRNYLYEEQHEYQENNGKITIKNYIYSPLIIKDETLLFEKEEIKIVFKKE